MVKEDIETVIDKLYDLVKAGNKVTVKEAALALSLTEEQVEKLAMILEESDLIEIQYTLGGSILMPKKTEQQKTMIPFAQPKAAKEEEVLEDIKSVENVAEFIEKDFIERLSKAEKALSAASARKDLKKSDIEAIRKELSFLQERLKTFQENVKKIELGEVSFEQKISKFQEKLLELEKTSFAGEKKNALAFLAHFLAFLIAWFQNLTSNKKQASQAKPKAEEKKPQPQPEGTPKREQKNALPSLGKIQLPNFSISKSRVSEKKTTPESKPRNTPRKREKPARKRKGVKKRATAKQRSRRAKKKERR
ncbi:MAG: hypothetical protein QXR53_03500 [Candidatus Norongarragalinales archaeon]